MDVDADRSGRIGYRDDRWYCVGSHDWVGTGHIVSSYQFGVWE